MNLKESTDEAPNDVFFASFCYDLTCFYVASKNVYSIYSVAKVEELCACHGIVADEVRIIEFGSPGYLLAVVTNSDPRILNILDTAKECEVHRYSFPNTILAVKVSKMLLVVCLEESLHIFSQINGREVRRILSSPPNPLGLCILSQNIDKNFLAYPRSSSKGEVEIHDTDNDCSVGMIAAHKNPLAAMAFNWTATMIATASDRGTVIRVFDVIEQTKLYEFRLGVTRFARIYSLCFSQDSNYLSSSSNTETVHIFRLDNMIEEASAEEPQGLFSYLTNMMVGLLTHARTAPTSMHNEDSAFATVRLPFSGIRNICALARIQDSLRVLIVSGERILYIYNVDSVNGGECGLERTFDLSELGRNVLGPPENKPLRFLCVKNIAK